MPTCLRRVLLVASTLAALVAGPSAALADPPGGGLGTEDAQLQVTPAGPVAFGNVVVGDMDSRILTVENVGDAPLDITEAALVSGGDSSHFGVGDGCSFGAPLAPDETCELNVQFIPTTTGAKTATVHIVSDATGSPHDITLTGTGTQPGLQLSGTSLTFADRSVDDGPSAAQTITVTNSGTAPLNIAGVNTSGTGQVHFPVGPETCTAAPIAPAATCTVQVTFDPAQRGALTASLDLISDAPGTPHSVSLSGTGIGPDVTLTPTSLGFGNVLVGTTSAPLTATVTNDGDGPLTVGTVEITGADPSDYAIHANTCTSPVAPAASCTIQVEFAPNTPGLKNADLSIASNAGLSADTMPLTGTGLEPAVSLSAPTISFADREVDAAGASTPQTVTVTNSGTAPLHVGTIGLSGADTGAFVLTNDTCSSATVAVGDDCTVDVAFDPPTPGVKSASLSFPSDAPSTPDSVVLSGTGIQPALNARTTMPFGAQPIDEGATPSQRILVENTGTATLDVGTVVKGGPDAASFAIVADTCSGAAIAPSATCAIDITFDPAAETSYAATITIPSDAPGSPHLVDLTGAGAPAGAAPVVGVTPGTDLDFGSHQVAAGPTAPLVLTVANTGNANLDLSTTTVGGADGAMFSLGTDTCEDAVVGPGTDCSVGVLFDPSSTGAKTATLTIASLNTPDIVVTLDGTGTQPGVSRNPASLDFGTTAVFAPSPVTRTVTVTSSGTADLVVSALTIQNDPAAAFSVSAGATTCSPSDPVEPSTTCTVTVEYDPGTAGTHTAQLRIASDAPDSPHTVDLQGTATMPGLSLSTTSIDFGDRSVAAGPSAAQTVTVTNTGAAALSVSAVDLAGADAADFVLSGDTCDGATVAPAGTCHFDLAFDPSLTGARTATVTITSDAPSSPDTVTLTGDGVSAPGNTALPVISGTAADGAVLTATDGTWAGGGPVTYGRQWRACDASGAACVDIGGATGATFTAGAAQVGKTLRIVVTATNGSGSGSATSAASAVVAPGATTPPVVSGTPAIGSDLTVDDGGWNGAAGLTLSVRWERCPAAGDPSGCAAIPGATGRTYRVTDLDGGRRLRAVVTARAGASTEVSSPSALTAIVAEPGAPGSQGGTPGGPGGGSAPGGATAPAGGGGAGARVLDARVTVAAAKKAKAKKGRPRTAVAGPRPVSLAVTLSGPGSATALLSREVTPSAKAVAAAKRRCVAKRGPAKAKCLRAARAAAKAKWVPVGGTRTVAASPQGTLALGKLAPGRYRVVVTTAAGGAGTTRAFTVPGAAKKR